MRQSVFAAGALSRAPLGELTALPRLSSWVCGRGIGKEDGKGQGGKANESGRKGKAERTAR